VVGRMPKCERHRELKHTVFDLRLIAGSFRTGSARLSRPFTRGRRFFARLVGHLTLAFLDLWLIGRI